MRKQAKILCRKTIIGMLALVAALSGTVQAETWHLAGTELARIDASADRNPSPLKVDMARIGTLRPRGANEITGSNWTLGCECLDRDFTDFDQYKDYNEIPETLPVGQGHRMA